MKPVTIIGTGMTPDDLTASQLKIITQADVLVGGKRLLDHFKDLKTRKKTIGRNIDAVLNFVKEEMQTRNVVVLASGDPMFFGIGARLVAGVGANDVVILPNISSVAAAFARIKEPWNDVQVVSLHGRKNERHLFRELEKGKTLAVLTDPKNNPARLAALLLAREILNYKICVLEQLGSHSEKFNWYTLGQAAGIKFSEPNLVVLKRGPIESLHTRTLQLGTPDSWYDHEKGLITKSELRPLILAKLRLATDHILWDLGAGSGSVALEASLFIKKGKIFALERSPERVEQIQNNRRRFGVDNLSAICADLPRGLADLPRPDRVFIGGGGKDLKTIIDTAARCLKPAGVMVVNTVLIPNVQVALNALKHFGFETEAIQVQINRSREMPWAERLEAQNPVWIISGSRISDFRYRNKRAD